MPRRPRIEVQEAEPRPLPKSMYAKSDRALKVTVNGHKSEPKNQEEKPTKGRETPPPEAKHEQPAPVEAKRDIALPIFGAWIAFSLFAIYIGQLRTEVMVAIILGTIAIGAFIVWDKTKGLRDGKREGKKEKKVEENTRPDPTPEEPKKGEKVVMYREQLWSEAHPGGWKTAKDLLPRLHMIALALFLVYLVMMELMASNYDFLVDWYQATWILPAFVEVTASEQSLQFWWENYGMEFIVVASFLVLCFVVFYMVAWRAWFKSYVKYSEGEPKGEGRCYWRSNNMWTRWWDRAYRSPPRKLNTYYINQGRFFNIFNPPASLIRLDTGRDEECEEKGLWKIQVSEKRLRRKVGNSSRWLTTAEEMQENGIILTEEANVQFESMSKKCVKDTTDLSFANASTRNTVMTSGLRLITPGIRKAIVDARERQDNNRSAQ